MSLPASALVARPGALLARAGVTLAQSKQDQFLRSVSDGGSSSLDGIMLLQIGIGAAVLLLGGVALRRYWDRRKNPAKRRVKDAFKLQRELARGLSITPAEMRKLEFHAARLGVANPLTLLLCPSLIERETESKLRNERQNQEQAGAPTPQPAELL